MEQGSLRRNIYLLSNRCYQIDRRYNPRNPEWWFLPKMNLSRKPLHRNHSYQSTSSTRYYQICDLCRRCWCSLMCWHIWCLQRMRRLHRQHQGMVHWCRRGIDKLSRWNILLPKQHNYKASLRWSSKRIDPTWRLHRPLRCLKAVGFLVAGQIRCEQRNSLAGSRLCNCHRTLVSYIPIVPISLIQVKI